MAWGALPDLYTFPKDWRIDPKPSADRLFSHPDDIERFVDMSLLQTSLLDVNAHTTNPPLTEEQRAHWWGEEQWHEVASGAASFAMPLVHEQGTINLPTLIFFSVHEFTIVTIVVRFAEPGECHVDTAKLDGWMYLPSGQPSEGARYAATYLGFSDTDSEEDVGGWHWFEKQTIARLQAATRSAFRCDVRSMFIHTTSSDTAGATIAYPTIAPAVDTSKVFFHQRRMKTGSALPTVKLAGARGSEFRNPVPSMADMVRPKPSALLIGDGRHVADTAVVLFRAFKSRSGQKLKQDCAHTRIGMNMLMAEPVTSRFPLLIEDIHDDDDPSQRSMEQRLAFVRNAITNSCQRLAEQLQRTLCHDRARVVSTGYVPARRKRGAQTQQPPSSSSYFSHSEEEDQRQPHHHQAATHGGKRSRRSNAAEMHDIGTVVIDDSVWTWFFDAVMNGWPR